VLELDCGLEFDAMRAEEDFFPALPTKAAVCLIEPRKENAEPFLIRTQNLQRRLQRLLGPVDPASKRLNLSDFARGIRYRLTGSPFEQTLTYYQHAKQLFPKRYRDLMRLRPAAVLKVNLRNAYPRCYVTRRIPVDETGVPTGGAYYGPFPSRRFALAFAERILDLFKVRRCQIKIRRDPTFPGCIYSEMKMCLAPCFKGCTDDGYHAEVARVQTYFDTAGDSLLREITQQRDQASTHLEFENAAALHAAAEKLKPVLGQLPEIVRRIDQLTAIMVQPCAIPESVAFFPIDAGLIAGPLPFTIQATEHTKSQSMESRVQATLATLPPPSAKNALEIMEHLALLKRWFYRGTRSGEIFFADPKLGLPLRRLVRGIARVYRGETSGEETKIGT